MKDAGALLARPAARPAEDRTPIPASGEDCAARRNDREPARSCVSSSGMKWTPTQLRDLQNALLSAFPTHAALASMVRFRLDENLAAIAGGDNLTDVVYNLLRWAEAHDGLDALLDGAAAENPRNRTLAELVARLRPEAPRPPPARPTPPAAAPSSPPPSRRLRDVLATLYSNPHDIPPLLDDAGLDRTRIDLQGPARNVWHAVIAEANKHGKLPALLDVARADYPANAELAEIAAAFGAAPAGSSPAQGAPATQREELFDRLSQMLPAQFEEVLFRLGVAVHHLSSARAPQGVRARELVELQSAKGEEGLRALNDAIVRTRG